MLVCLLRCCLVFETRAFGARRHQKCQTETLQELCIHEFLFLIKSVPANPAEKMYLDPNLLSV